MSSLPVPVPHVPSASLANCLCACGAVFTAVQDHVAHLRSRHAAMISTMSHMAVLAAGMWLCSHPGCVFISAIKNKSRHAKTHAAAPSSTVRTAAFLVSPRRTRSRSAFPVRALATLGHSDHAAPDPALLAARQEAASKRRGKLLPAARSPVPVPAPVPVAVSPGSVAFGSPVPRERSAAVVPLSSLSSLSLMS